MCVVYLSPNYQARLKVSNIRTLQRRMMKFDLALCNRIVKQMSDIYSESISSLVEEYKPRTHSLQLKHKMCPINSVCTAYSLELPVSGTRLQKKAIETQSVSVF